MYSVEFLPSAATALSKLDRHTQLRIARAIDRLADDPRGAGAVKLKGSHHAWRIRLSDFRVLYEIRDAVMVVLVISVGHRARVYR
jgi:mRNA interferase RelE/StbE